MDAGRRVIVRVEQLAGVEKAPPPLYEPITPPPTPASPHPLSAPAPETRPLASSSSPSL